MARRDVEEGQFIGTGRVVGDRRLDRIAGVAEIDEVDALDDAAVLDVEAGNDADLEHPTQCLAAGILAQRSPLPNYKPCPSAGEVAAGRGLCIYAPGHSCGPRWRPIPAT